jgi:catechol 2,3-dioxygenase-like lactoylglutathione lyase family enzyme
MPTPFNRPIPAYNPQKGLLHNEHFQLGYVTNDMPRALAIFRDRFGISRWRENDADLPGGGRVSTRTVWIGAMMFEIALGFGENMECFSDFAPPGGEFVLKFHHFGYLVPDEASWAVLEGQMADSGLKVIKPSDMPGYVKTCFLEVPELDHLLEYILPREGLIARFNETPVA